MNFEEIKNAKTMFVPAGDRSGSLSASIQLLLKTEALTMREICDKLKVVNGRSLSGTLLQMKKKGVVVSFYVEGKNDQYFVLTKKVDELGLG